MQRLEFSGAVRPLQWSLGVKWLTYIRGTGQFSKLPYPHWHRSSIWSNRAHGGHTEVTTYLLPSSKLGALGIFTFKHYMCFERQFTDGE